MISQPSQRGWLEQRIHLSAFRAKYLRKAFPVHPSFFLGEIALFSFILLIVTGIYLAFSYVPSTQAVSSEGQSVPAAFDSVVRLDQQPFGLIVRRVHHWSAHLMIAATILHLLRIFFTGAFKKPREINWLIGCLLLLLSILAAFSGYLLPYDEFAVTATGIGYGIAASIPWVGTALAEFIFAGKFPAMDTIPRFYGYHIMLFPLLLFGLIALHMTILMKQKHTEPLTNRGKLPQGQLLGIPLWPQQGYLMVELFLLMTGVLLVLATVFPVHPVEVYGPPGPETPAVKPDWYFLWVYGLLKLIPGWMEFHLWGGIINPEVIGGILLPGILIVLIFLVPFFKPSKDDQHYLEPLTQQSVRTSVGLGVMALLLVLSVAGYEDVLGISLNAFRIAAVMIPLGVGVGAYAVLQAIVRRS